MYDLKDIKCANPQITYSTGSLSGAEVIARTIRGTPCGFEKKLGKGILVHLGTWIGFDTEGHKPVYEAILNRSGAKLRQASASNENIAVRQRFTKERQGLLFIGNYYNEEQAGKIYYTHPESGETISIPYTGEGMLWPALHGVMTPLGLDLAEGLTLLHSTSDIIGIDVLDNRIDITLYGERDLAGEIVVEGRNISKIQSATMDGKAVNISLESKRVVLSYQHKHREAFVISVVTAV